MRTRLTWFLTAIALAIGAVACSGHAQTQNCTGVRNVVKLFGCLDEAQRHDFISGLVAKTGTKQPGLIDFEHAAVLSGPGLERGILLVPARQANGNWAMLEWHLNGEFERYAGTKEL